MLLHRRNQQTADYDSNDLQSTDDESNNHHQVDDNIRLTSNPSHYELQPKRQEARNRERKMNKIHDVNLTSTNTPFQETQGQGTSNIHNHNQDNQTQEQQCLQSTDFYQDANNIIRSNQLIDRELG